MAILVRRVFNSKVATATNIIQPKNTSVTHLSTSSEFLARKMFRRTVIISITAVNDSIFGAPLHNLSHILKNIIALQNKSFIHELITLCIIKYKIIHT